MEKSEEILARKARYDVIEREADRLGRVIGVKRLRPSEQNRLQELTPLRGEDLMVAVIAAAVREIDSTPVPFPKTRAELDAILDSLDEEGIEAAAAAAARLSGAKPTAETVEAAKN